MQQRAVIIVAGGKGERMNAALPKQFLALCGVPILMRAVQRFYDFDPAIEPIVVLPPSQLASWEALCGKHRFSLKHKVVTGGETRFHSVKNGLAAVSPNVALIAVHDGVRPLVDSATIRRCFREAEQSGAAIPVVELIDTIRQVDGESSTTADRQKFRAVQTPQVFRSEILRKSYEQPYVKLFTDDASVVEAAGYTVKMVDGNRENIKITNPLDLQLATVLLNETR